MGKSYKIECKRCEAQYLYSADGSYGVMPTCVGCGAEDRTTVVCPQCRMKVVVDSPEFFEQVIEENF